MTSVTNGSNLLLLVIGHKNFPPLMFACDEIRSSLDFNEGLAPDFQQRIGPSLTISLSFELSC
jgi:hypothetical protein